MLPASSFSLICIIFIFKVHGPLNFNKRFRAPQELFMKRDNYGMFAVKKNMIPVHVYGFCIIPDVGV
jgi:hypothetical protein